MVFLFSLAQSTRKVQVYLQPTIMIELKGDNNKQQKYDEYISIIDELKTKYS